MTTTNTVDASQSSMLGSLIGRIQDSVSALFALVQRVISAVWNCFTCSSSQPAPQAAVTPVTTPISTPQAPAPAATSATQATMVRQVAAVTPLPATTATTASGPALPRGGAATNDTVGLRGQDPAALRSGLRSAPLATTTATRQAAHLHLLQPQQQHEQAAHLHLLQPQQQHEQAAHLHLLQPQQQREQAAHLHLLQPQLLYISHFLRRAQVVHDLIRSQPQRQQLWLDHIDCRRRQRNQLLQQPR